MLDRLRDVPGVLQYENVFHTEPGVALVLPFYDLTLGRLCKIYERGLPEEMSWALILSVGQALASMHERNLIHLDVKPDNILLRRDGHIVLCDFGISIDMSSPPNFPVDGDGIYLAPEVLNETPTTAADAFSFGITLLEGSCPYLVGQPPIKENIRQDCFKDEYFWPEVSADLRDLIKALCASKAQHRLTLAAAVAKAQQHAGPHLQAAVIECIERGLSCVQSEQPHEPMSARLAGATRSILPHSPRGDHLAPPQDNDELNMSIISAEVTLPWMIRMIQSASLFSRKFMLARI
ncbi:uncharacterized protein MONBRDRAFT_32366 [Monosiga brevicollis MX1]|uniref:non-specific serine/threonine protein kinase n=1 Tax=Monosiga brevicollis TaxID=81824 RepID=A9UZ34_MONBE|nr:uncharacterized protein MONBRDRAFT_32366 [Monosiga brevicollis MX1]EDQ89715.1 predicted protein [Monosiga brevicollis MX1]|eukprot:XP_001745744.1 hypothetical protein [Monosiga brevicollis MX1]